MTIIPQPAIYDKSKGCFLAKNLIKIKCDCRQIFEKYCNTLGIFLDAEYSEEDCNFFVEKAKNLEVEYSINVEENKITILYRTERDLFYALVTVKQLFNADLEIACCNILDKHRYDYRGLLVDTNKDFLTVEYIKKLANVMVNYKMNALHIRFNENNFCVPSFKDDNNEIPSDKISDENICENVEISQSIIEKTSENKAKFSRESLKSLVEYCKERFILIVPEIDLSVCVERLFMQANKDNESKLLNADILEYCKEIIAGIAEIFDGELLHIGFENVSEKIWKKCDLCKEKMAETGIKKFYKLIEYFWEKISAIAMSYGKKLVLFGNEIKSKPPKGAILQWCHHDFKKTNCGAWMRRNGNCILSPASYFYLNDSYNKLPLSKVYSIDMMFVGVPINLRKNVLGYECCFWNKKRQIVSWKWKKCCFLDLLLLPKKVGQYTV